jgi:hypothetical protein
MKLTNTQKQNLIAALNTIGLNISGKLDEFKTFGTFVVAANQAKKKKLDVAIKPFIDLINITEFDDHMWRISDTVTSLSIIQMGRETQCH